METEKTLLLRFIESFTPTSSEGRGVASFCEDKHIPFSIRTDFVNFVLNSLSKITTDNYYAFTYLMDTMSHEDVNVFWLQFTIELKNKILNTTGGF